MIDASWPMVPHGFFLMVFMVMAPTTNDMMLVLATLACLIACAVYYNTMRWTVMRTEYKQDPPTETWGALLIYLIVWCFRMLRVANINTTGIYSPGLVSWLSMSACMEMVFLALFVYRWMFL